MRVAPTHVTISIGDTVLDVVRGGNGAPLLVLHDELGYAGWMSWHAQMAETRHLIVPLQPGCGHSASAPWIRSYRDLGALYARFVREQGLAPIDIIGFSAGAYAAAELVAASPELVGRLVLVAPLGVRPSSGEIFDFLGVTVRAHVDALAGRGGNDYDALYSGDLQPEQFQRIEEARAEAARIGWEPFMFDASLPHLLDGVAGVPTRIVWGDADRVCPRGCVDVFHSALADSEVVVLDDLGHCPELEDPAGFTATLSEFLSLPD